MSIKIKQRDITDCGAACIASITSHYKLKLPVSRIRQIAGTDKKGTNVYGLLQAAEKLGFTAKGVKGNKDALPKIPVPAIAHVVVKEVLQHYVVIYKVTEKYIQIMDPGTGLLEKMPLDKFVEIWTGVLVLMIPNDGFNAKNEKVSNLSRFIYLLHQTKISLHRHYLGQ